MRFDLTDAEWAEIEPLIPKAKRSMRRDDRMVLNGILHVLRTGCPWRDMPASYGPRTTIYNRFNRWASKGVWQKIFEKLATRSRRRLRMIDSTIVKAHRAASGAKGGKRGKRSVVLAAVGRPKSTRSLMIASGPSVSS